jgi:hypothetical protein
VVFTLLSDQNGKGVCANAGSWSLPDSVAMGWGPRVYISSKFQGDTAAVVSEIRLPTTDYHN